MNMAKDFLELEVIEAKQRNVDKNVVGIASSDLDSVGLISGDIVELKSNESFYSRAIRVSDTWQGTISLDLSLIHI